MGADVALFVEFRRRLFPADLRRDDEVRPGKEFVECISGPVSVVAPVVVAYRAADAAGGEPPGVAALLHRLKRAGYCKLFKCELLTAATDRE